MSEILIKTMSDSSYQTTDSSVFEAVLVSDRRKQELVNNSNDDGFQRQNKVSAVVHQLSYL